MKGTRASLTVTSAANERVKLIRSLAGPSARRKRHMTLVEGITLVNEALESGVSFVTVACEEEASSTGRVAHLAGALHERGVEVWAASRGVFRSLAQTETPQGIIAAIRVPDVDVDGVLGEVMARARAPEGAIVVLMDGVQDPGNAGAIVRSADAFGASCAIFAAGSADPYNPKVLRASAGSIFHLPCVTLDEASSTLDGLIAGGFRLFYGDARSSTPVFGTDLTGAVVIAVGNEAAGVSPAVRSRGSGVAVPIHGKAESLNVAMALTAILYEASRQRSVAL